MSRKSRLAVLVLPLSVASSVLTPLPAQASSADPPSTAEPAPFCQTRAVSGDATETRVSVSPDVAPLLSGVKWASLSVEGAWELASKVLALSGPIPAALIADADSQSVLKRYIDEIWAGGRFGGKPAYYFEGKVRTSRARLTVEKELRPDAVARFLGAVSTAYHETIHYLQVERCDRYRELSIDRSEVKARLGDSLYLTEIDVALDLIMRSKAMTGLVILPISPDRYLTGSSGIFHLAPRRETVLRAVRALIDDEVDGPCRVSMDNISEGYFSVARYPLPPNYYDPLDVQGSLREAQAWVMTAELMSHLEDVLAPNLEGRTVGEHIGAGTFFVYMSVILENLRQTTGAWDALRADGTDKALLWMMNVHAKSWRHRRNHGARDYACGQVIYGPSSQALRDFVSTAGVPDEPREWAGRYIRIEANPECNRGQQCTMKLSLTPPARLTSVVIGTRGLKFDRKSMAIRGKPSRRGWSGISVRVRVKGREFAANINVTTK